LHLFAVETKKSSKEVAAFSDPALASNKTLPVHRWVPWIAGFSSDFVRQALEKHLDSKGTVLDPFAGVGTTLQACICLEIELWIVKLSIQVV